MFELKNAEIPGVRSGTRFTTISILSACLLSAFGLSFQTAHANDGWRVQVLDASDYPKNLVPETRKIADGGLPDGLVAESSEGDIRAAWYSMPTDRYGHAVIGDGIEAGSLVAVTRDNDQIELVLPKNEVFEDRYPRLADLDGDGSVEIITIRSSTSTGAAVSIYGLANGRLIQRASTDFIGRANRWLNIAGIADFDGKPGLEIAYVRTPHIGGTLIYYSYANGHLRQVGSLDGFSNHEIGSRELRLSAISDVDGDGIVDLALPSKDRRRLRIIGFDDGTPRELASIPVDGRIDKAITVITEDDSVSFVAGLEDGSVVSVSR